MKKIISALGVLAIVLSMMTSVTVMTGCDEVLGTDTVSIEKLSVPYVDSVEILEGADSVKIHVSGTFTRKEDFAGFVVASDTAIDTTNILLRDTIDEKGTTWSGTKSYTMPITSWDQDETWWVAAFNEDFETSQPMPAYFYARVENTAEPNAYSWSSITSNDGIDVDNIPEVENVEDGIQSSTANPYATNSGADIIFEAASGGGLGITPIGGAVVFLSSEDALYTQDQIETIYTDSYQNEVTDVTIDGETIYVYALGKSIRPDGASSGGLHTVSAGEVFIVITSAKNVARIVIDSVDGLSSVSLTVYQDSGKNEGVPLYKEQS